MDRYAYVNNSPIRYTDPSGHRIDDGDEGSRSCKLIGTCKNDKPIMVILVCGNDTTAGCQSPDNWASYGGIQPLSEYANWAEEQGYQFAYFGTGEGGENAGDIAAFMQENSGAQFIMVGHSLGADTVIGAANQYIESGGNAEDISGIVLLDPDLTSEDDPSAGDNQSDIDNLTTQNIDVQSHNSWAYEWRDWISSVTGITLPTDSRWNRKFENHWALATDQIQPIINEWDK